jgi:hypothetical protein
VIILRISTDVLLANRLSCVISGERYCLVDFSTSGRREAKMREASLFLTFSIRADNLNSSSKISMSKGVVCFCHSGGLDRMWTSGTALPQPLLTRSEGVSLASHTL